MAEPTASLQLVSGVLRLHPDGGVLGSPYSWACTVVATDGTAHLLGAPGDPKHVSALARALLAAGFTRVTWERRTGGGGPRTAGPYDLEALAGRGGRVGRRYNSAHEHLNHADPTDQNPGPQDRPV